MVEKEIQQEQERWGSFIIATSREDLPRFLRALIVENARKISVHRNKDGYNYTVTGRLGIPDNPEAIDSQWDRICEARGKRKER